MSLPVPDNMLTKNTTKRFVVALVVFASATMSAHAADLIFTPSVGTKKVGDTLTVDVYVSDNKDAINAVASDVLFDKDVLELTSIRKTGSTITMWVEEPTFSNENGKASFQGAILNPGFAGPQGKIITLTFRAKKTGDAKISFSHSSVLSNDGDATNVLGQAKDASFTIEANPDVPDEVVGMSDAPVVISTSHPDITKWYSKKDIALEWIVPAYVTQIRTLFDQGSTSQPVKVYDSSVVSRQLVSDRDGVSYFHVQFKGDSGWGAIKHFPVHVDTTAPDGLTASLVDGAVTRNPRPQVTVTATDTLSGIESVGFSVDGDQEVLSPYSPLNVYTLPKKRDGKHETVVAVYDKAGNKVTATLSYTVDPIEVPTIKEYSKNVEKGSPFVVSGMSYPQAVVEVTLTDDNGQVKSQSTTADGMGVYSLAWANSLSPGVYEMRVRSIDTKGAVSEYSDTRVVKVESMPFIRIGVFIMNTVSLVLVSIISLFLVGATFWYSFVQFSRFRRRVHRTMRDTEMTLRANVLALRRDTEEFHNLLLKAEKKRELTKEESSILKKFKKRLDVTEKEIEKKLEAIG